MLLGCIADDFTGASDLANTLAKAGMNTVQFCGIPADGAEVACDAGVVALKTRSIAVDDAVNQSLAALEWLKSQGCRQFFFKYCSTFDSTKQGNIGPVAEALLEALGAPLAIVCPAFPAAGRSIYMGHLFVFDRLLNESGMQNHPLTPMTDPDIRRWLSYQTKLAVGHVGIDVVAKGAEAVADALLKKQKDGDRLIVLDAVSDKDLLSIGHAAKDVALVTGGSGIALGLPDNFRAAGLLKPADRSFEGLDAHGVVLSGSCSKMSVQQVEHYRANHPSLFIDADELIAGKITVDAALDFVLAHPETAPMVYSTATPAIVSAQQQRHGAKLVAEKIESFFGALASALVAEGVCRIVVGGGETSGAVVEALDLVELSIGPEIATGVPALAAERDGPLRLALKSGNFGQVDFFETAVAALGH